jgi:hypothetical protein
LRESQVKAAIVAPTEGSKAVTVATAKDNDQNSNEDAFDERFADYFAGIDWARLPQFTKPLATQKQRKNWVYPYGYRVTLLNASTSKWFVGKYCHQHEIIDAGGAGHNLTKDGLKPLT